MRRISGISCRSRCRFRRSWLPPVALRGAAEKAQGGFHVFGLLVEQDKRANGGEVVSSAEIILRFLERGDEFVQGKIEGRAECRCDGAGHCGLRASGARASSSMNSGKRVSSSSVPSTMRRATACRESESIGMLKSLSILQAPFLSGLSSSKEPLKPGSDPRTQDSLSFREGPHSGNRNARISGLPRKARLV